MVDSTNSELYTHDSRDRLTQFERGTLNAPGTAITTPTPSTYLIQSREWVSLDRRGNWLDTQTTVDSVQTGDTRQRNAVNEYTSKEQKVSRTKGQTKGARKIFDGFRDTPRTKPGNSS